MSMHNGMETIKFKMHVFSNLHTKGDLNEIFWPELRQNSRQNFHLFLITSLPGMKNI
jgi:hypothetical protein